MSCHDSRAASFVCVKVADYARRFISNVGSVGIGLSACSLPGNFINDRVGEFLCLQCCFMNLERYLPQNLVLPVSGASSFVM